MVMHRGERNEFVGMIGVAPSSGKRRMALVVVVAGDGGLLHDRVNGFIPTAHPTMPDVDVPPTSPRVRVVSVTSSMTLMEWRILPVGPPPPAEIGDNAAGDDPLEGYRRMDVLVSPGFWFRWRFRLPTIYGGAVLGAKTRGYIEGN